jgi:hypothetical protein
VSSLLNGDGPLLRETTPAQTTPDLRAFVQELGAEEPTLVPVVPGPGSEPGWCYRNVARVVAEEGGEAVHGWAIWACDLFATAEFHVVRRRGDGSLVDVTPKSDGEKQILFAIDPSRPADFDFMLRPPNRRTRLYRGLSAERRAADLIACMSSVQANFEARRADKAGKSLQGFVASRMGRERLEHAIDGFLACCAEAESLLRPTSEGQWCKDIPRWQMLEERKAELQRRLTRAWQAHPARAFGAVSSGGPHP